MPKSLIRKPAVSGQFYSDSSDKLRKEIKNLIDKQGIRTEALGCILPHAGYIYSGAVAAKTVSSLKVPDNVILLGPNHTGYGAAFSIMTEGKWQTPLGIVEINTQLARAMLNKSVHLKDDMHAHIYEHSLEVEIPLLQYINPHVKIVPIITRQASIEIYKDIGRDIAAVLKESDMTRNTLIIASSDMTHYEPQRQAEKKDREAIEAILTLDEDSLFDKINRFDITMCGAIPVIIAIAATKLLGAKTARLISYQTSGDITGDYNSVVGYAGIIII